MADIKNIDVFQTVTSVSFEVEPNTNVININKVNTSGYTGVPNLQEVTDEGANTTNGISINVGQGGQNGISSTSSQGYGVYGESSESSGVYGNSSSATGVYGNSFNGTGVYAISELGTGLYSYSEYGVGVSAYSNSIGLEVNGNGTIAIEANLGNSNKGLVINSGASSTGNFIELDKNGVDKLIVNQQGELTATKLIKQGGTSAQFLMADGSVSTGVSGATNLTSSQTATNFTINSDTGTDANIPLGNGTLAGATINDYTTTEKNKLSGIAVGAEVNVNANWNATSGDAQILNKPTISGTNTGDQNLQQVTNLGASTTNPINANVAGVSTGITGGSANGKGVNGYSETGIGVDGFSTSGIGVNGYSEQGVGGNFETDSISANIADFKSSGVLRASVTNNGNINANGFVKSGGTSSQILAADGSVITAGTNITITGGQISSVGGTGGGGSSVNYYLNGGTIQGAFGGTTYYKFSKTAVIGTGADFNISSNGYIASFITDVADPSLLLIPGGNWNLEFFFSSSSAGGSPSFYVELYKYDGTTFTSIASSSANPEGITGGTAIDAYFTSLAIPETILTVNDRLAIRVFVNASSKTITLHTQNGHLCEVITTFTAGLTALNGLQAQVQGFATGTTGTDFAINSSGSTHTFNLPSASATARGVVTTSSQTFAGDKTFTGAIGASNLSGTNTGDETITTIKTKLGITTLSGSNTGDQDLSSYAPLASPTFTGTPSLPTGTTGTTQTPLNNSTRLATTEYVEAACAVVASSGGVTVSTQDTYGTANIATVTATQYATFVTAGTVSATTLYFITA